MKRDALIVAGRRILMIPSTIGMAIGVFYEPMRVLAALAIGSGIALFVTRAVSRIERPFLAEEELRELKDDYQRQKIKIHRDRAYKLRRRLESPENLRLRAYRPKLP
jgi:hypothetical protein